MKVHFGQGRRNLGVHDLDAVPRAGEGVTFGEAELLIVWNVAWLLEGDEPVAHVELVTSQERDRRLR